VSVFNFLLGRSVVPGLFGRVGWGREGERTDQPRPRRDAAVRYRRPWIPDADRMPTHSSAPSVPSARCSVGIRYRTILILKTHGGQPPDGCFRLWPRAESADLKVAYAYVGGASTNFRSLLLICVTERHRDFYPCVSRVANRFWLAAPALCSCSFAALLLRVVELGCTATRLNQPHQPDLV
jgi:hypothetical protein